jgi:HTH-type transcriptional regulator/antitoxin HigA
LITALKGGAAMIRSKDTIAIPPGATIKEQLIDRGMTQKEFALRMDMSEKHISRLINGEVQLTQDVAGRLESVLGISARFWNNLENIYRENLLKVKAENDMADDIETAKSIPYNEMAKNRWVENTRSPLERVMNLRKFFEVAYLGLLNEPLIPGIACRKLGEGKTGDYYKLIVWAQRAKLEARNIKTAPINIQKLAEYIPDIRAMTIQNPEVFCPELRNKLAECGIALVFLPHIGGSFLHGATFYDGRKIVVGMTVRGKYADRFWFSLFHELAHIIQGHIGQSEGTTDKDESNADTYASNVLIPAAEFDAFTANNDFSKESIISFAESVGIDAGMGVGRLQKEKYISFSLYGELKTKYELSA